MVNIIGALDLIGLSASLVFLSFSSWKDIMTREVTDRLWRLFYPMGLVLLAARLLAQTDSWLSIAVSLTSAFAISIALPYLGLWGGADGKAFLCLAIMNPLIPSFDIRAAHIVDPFLPLVVFSNAYIVSLFSVLYAVCRNLRIGPLHTLYEGFEGESRFHKMVAFLTGYRVSVDELESRPFLFPLERARVQGLKLTRHFKFDLSVNSDPQKELAEMKVARDSGLLHGTVWVSPGLPFLVFMTGGLVLTLLLGDIVWIGVSAVMRFVVAGA